MLPDGGHGLDAEEQGRGKVVDSSDALGKNRLGREKIARFSPSCDQARPLPRQCRASWCRSQT